MTYAIPDNFNDKFGRFLLWDTTVDFDSSKGFLNTNQHVNLRNFRTGGARPILLQEVEALGPQQNYEAPVVEQALETGGIVSAENWVKTGNGFSALAVGAVLSKNNWSALTMTTTGVAVATTLTSSMTDVIDISAMDVLSIVFPDYNSFDGTSYVQLCSNASGDFSTNTSAQVPFSANTSAMPELRFNISAFAAAGFNAAAVTGVRIVLNKAAAPAAGLTCSVMAIRALKSTWTYHQIDIDTRLGALVVPVTLNGSTPAGGTGPLPIIRGQGDKDDPIPADTALNCYFSSGGEGGWVATGSNYNTIELIVREFSDVADGLGSRMTIRFRWNSTGSFCDTLRYDYAGGVGTNVGVHTVSVGSILTPASRYLLRAEIVGTNINVTLYVLDGNNVIQNVLWKHPSVSDPAYTFRNGRVGLYMSTLDRDVFIDKIEAATTNYATLETTVNTQRHPVDGAQLAARFAGDMNLFQSYSGDLIQDQTKTVSGLGSYRTEAGITSNTFIVEDWNNTYLRFALWVPSTVTTKNSPKITLISQADGSSNTLITPKLQPAQWNYLHFDLAQFLSLITGVGYSLSIGPAVAPSTPLGPFWVDSTVIGRRRVRWGVRATPNGAYREFRDLVNDPNGAVHFKPDERGVALEMKCDALTSDAWVAQYDLIPRHAQLGNPVYDRGYATR